MAARAPVRAPFEGFIDKTIDDAVAFHGRLVDSRPAKAYNRTRRFFPRLPTLDVPTPFGQIKTPEFELPPLEPISVNERQREAYKAAIAIDLTFPLSWIPVVGDLAADVLEDTFGEKLRESLTDAEYTTYLQHDKSGPSTLAMIRTFANI